MIVIWKKSKEFQRKLILMKDKAGKTKHDSLAKW